MNYISLCLIALDENDYLPEWLDYHTLLGVERFYIYDNGSRVPLQETLQEYIQKGLVVVHSIAGRGMQLAAYDHCLQHYGEKNKWIGFIDADEFIVPKTGQDLAEFLKDYEPFGGIAISSLFFGSNGIKKKSGGQQIACFTQRSEEHYPWNRWVKCIVQPRRVAFPDSPHGFTFVCPFYCVNEDDRRVDDQNFPNHVNKIQLNHYFCRSEEDIQEKLNRKVAGDGRSYERQRFDEVNRLSIVEDSSIFGVISQLALKYEIDPDQTLPIKAGDISFLTKWLHKVTGGAEKPQDNNGLFEVSPRPEFLKYNQTVKKLVEAYKQKDIKSAISITQVLLENNPQKIILITSLANLTLYYKNFETAWQILEEAWKISPGNYEVLTQFSHYFFLTGKLDGAETALRGMLEIGPHEVDTLFRLAWTLAKQERLQEAIEIGYPLILTHGLGGEISFDNLGELLRLLGRPLLKMKDSQKVRKLGRIGLKIAPEDKEFKDWTRK